MLSHRENVRTSKFWRKSKDKKQKIFRKFTKGIWGFDLRKKIQNYFFHAYVPLRVERWQVEPKHCRSLAGKWAKTIENKIHSFEYDYAYIPSV